MDYDAPITRRDQMALFDDIFSGGNWVTGLAIGVGNPAPSRTQLSNGAVAVEAERERRFFHKTGAPKAICPAWFSSPLPRPNFALFFTRESDVGSLQCIMFEDIKGATKGSRAPRPG
jgi:hypothetical protein